MLIAYMLSLLLVCYITAAVFEVALTIKLAGCVNIFAIKLDRWVGLRVVWSLSLSRLMVVWLLSLS